MGAATAEKDIGSEPSGALTRTASPSSSPAVEDPSPKTDDQAAKTGNPALVYLQLLFFGATYLDVALIVVGTICAIAAGIPFPLMAILFGQLVNDLNGATCEAETNGSAFSYRDSINDKVLVSVYIAIAALALSTVYMICWNLVSQRLAQRLRERYFESLLRQDQSFFDKRHAGDVSSRLSGDIQAVQSGTCEKVGIFVGSISFFVTAYVVAFIKEPKLAGMLVSLVPAFLLVAIIGGGYTQKFATLVANAVASASSIASEALTHVAVVDAFGAGPRLEVKFAEYTSIARTEGIKKGMSIGVQAGMLYFIAYSANALAYWQGSIMIGNVAAGNGGGSSIGSIYTVVFIIVDACIILGAVAPLLPIFAGAGSAFERLRKDIERQSVLDGTSSTGQQLLQDVQGSIEFKNVTFAYPSRPDDPVLQNVNLSFPAGKFTAIVGPSGSGKSTIASLIARLHDPKEGSVLLDNQPITDLNIRSLRGLLSLVQQEPSLLDRSILENIALGLVNSPLASDERLKQVLLGPQLAQVAAQARELKSLPKVHDPEIAEIIERVCHAAELADAADFIGRLEDGYGTTVGSLGKSVSGGQRQRISLARALVRNPKVLILDEATASLDSASEQRIQAALDKVTKDRTVISIAHRLSTIRNADNIIVLKAGEVVEQGTYEELVAQNGVFAGMVNLQALSSSDQSGTLSSSSSTKGDDSLGISSARNETGQKKLTSTDAPQSETASEAPDESGLNPNQPFKQVLKDLGPFVKPNFSWLLLAMFAAVIVGCTYSASGLILGHTVGELNPCSSSPERIFSLGRFFSGMLFMLATVEFFANFISWSSFGVVAERLLHSIRVLSFRSLFEQSVEWHQSGDRDPSMLLSIITKDSAAIGGFSGSIMGTIFSIVVNFFVAIILAHVIAWKIAIVCLTMVPILLGSGIMQLRALSRYEERHAQAFAKSISITVEAVNSMKTISALSLEHEVMGTYRRVLSASQKDILPASIFTNIWLAISNCTSFFIYAFAYWWGGQLIMRGEYSQEQFFIVLISMLVSASLWGQMFTLAPEVSRSRASASRILSLIHAGSTTSPIPEKDISSRDVSEKDIEAQAGNTLGPVPTSNRGVSVSFDDVAFAYPKHPNILTLQDINITIQPGQFCGLVGPSGAGKSTIMALVQGMYTPTSGSVRIDNTAVSHHNFRDEIAIVPQDNALFNGTIRFNVSLGARPGHDATDSEIEEACKLANIHDTIMALPDKYDTECGPNGSQLSGGQRQRLTIARALVRKPRLLMLDESTSALDADSEMALQKGLDRVVRSEGITVIAITHRLHTVQRADVIFVVEGGRVVDSGKHEELIGRSESYRDNARFQMLQ